MSDDNQAVGESVSYSLAFSFPDPSPSFVHGYEAGAIGYRMQAGEAEISTTGAFPFHVANLELFKRMAAFHGYSLETDKVTCEGHEDSTFDIYVNCTFKKIEGGRPPKPSLRIVGSDDAA